jgi:FlaA1/EpsC-like NDP-sugar epimerase
MSPMIDSAVRVVRSNRRAVLYAAYATITVVAYALAYLIRFDLRWPREHTDTFCISLAVLVTIRLIFVRLARLTSSQWRFVSLVDLLRLLVATFFGSGVFYTFNVLAKLSPRVPHSVILVEGVLTSYLIAGAWVVYRGAYEVLRRRGQGVVAGKRVIIVGAGDGGYRLLRAIQRTPTPYQVVAFIDDSSFLWGTELLGVPVIGSTEDAGPIARYHRAEELIIAMPSLDVAEFRRVLGRCESAGLPIRVLPGISQVLSGEIRVDHLREVRIEDLLGREPIELQLPELNADLGGRSVLITGAAGSIGSELSRQVALHGPSRLVLFDQAETEMYYLELELRSKHPDLELVPVIGDIVDDAAVERVFHEYRPERVYHAAAYKHVPMMEMNAREAVRNNVIGTWRVADAAGRHGTGKFVLVSTDKAVRPSSVMGATKRLAELAVLELEKRYERTYFAAVRFGNVLGSNGSVIPIFKRQLAEGKPLTVTHPDTTRYFMTIPEAVQLILQASLLPSLRGNIAMLEMGEPVRILDLARNLLTLSGAGPNAHTQRIMFTGLRPGEKLHEELSGPDEKSRTTSIPKVRILDTPRVEGLEVSVAVEAWERALEDGRETAVLAFLQNVFPGVAFGAPSERDRMRALVDS